MNQVKLKELIQDKSIVIPGFIIKKYKEFNLTIDEFVLLIYLLDKDKQVFDPSVIAKDINVSLMDVMENMSNLADKGLVKIDTLKNEKGIMEEIINLEPFWSRVTESIVSILNTKEKDELNIYTLIENEFNRKLSPLECEMIDDWENNGYSKEIIKEAVKEASINGVTSLRYIDKILFDWDKKGIKSVSDIPRRQERKEEVQPEIISYDWLNDDDEEI